MAIARGMIPEENLVFDPDASLREVVKWTHYLPGEWKGKLHSQMVGLYLLTIPVASAHPCALAMLAMIRATHVNHITNAGPSRVRRIVLTENHHLRSGTPFSPVDTFHPFLLPTLFFKCDHRFLQGVHRPRRWRWLRLQFCRL